MQAVHEALEILYESSTDGRLGALCDQHGLDLVVVFGSAANPAVHEPNDLDIAVRFSQGVGADLVATTNDLIELVDNEAMDVLDLGRADVVARSRALSPPFVALYEREKGQFALTQMAALTEAMETSHMRRRDLELLARRACD